MGNANLTDPNVKWGICGFASTLGALYDSDPALRAKLNKILDDGHFETRLLADIKTFLVMLQADGKKGALLKEIEDFTKKFYKGFTVDAFIKRINGVVTHPQLLKDEFTLAMSENALLEYIKTNWDLKAKLTLGAGGAAKSKVILGIYDDKKALKHWVYQKNPKEVFNWGTSKAHAEMLKDCVSAGIAGAQVLCSIELP